MQLSRKRHPEFLDDMPSKRGWVVDSDETYPALAKRGIRKGGKVIKTIAKNSGILRKKKKERIKSKKGNPFNLMGW